MEAIPLELGGAGLGEAGFNEEFSWRTDEQEKTLNYLGTLAVFSEITSMMSIGAGEATMELELIKRSCPKLTKYIAVEPRLEAANLIAEKFKSLPQVEVTVIANKIGEYSGPKEAIDFVFFGNSSYYFRDTYQEMMQRALSWLSPAGILVDVCDNIRDLSLQSKIHGGESTGSKPHKHKDFMAWCWNHGWSVEGQLLDTEYDLDYTFDVSDPGMEQVFKFLIDTCLNDVQMNKVVGDDGRSVIKGTTHVPGKQLITVISHAQSDDRQEMEVGSKAS